MHMHKFWLNIFPRFYFHCFLIFTDTQVIIVKTSYIRLTFCKARMFRNKINKPFDVALGLAAYL